MKIQNLIIPEEIQDEIINHLLAQPDQVVLKDLSNYSLTSKTWLALVRRAYFKETKVIVGVENHQSKYFRRVLTPERANDPRSTIAPFVRVLAVIGPDFNVGRDPRGGPREYYRFERAVCECTTPLRLQIAKLSISGLEWSRLTQETIQAFRSFPHVKDLRIYDAAFGNISEFTNFITSTNFPELQNLALYRSQLGDGRARVNLQGQRLPTFIKHLSIDTRPQISPWIWSLKIQECQITGLSIGTLQDREQEDAVRQIIKLAGPKLQRLSVDYILPPESDQSPLLLQENSNLRTLRIGTFSALSRSSNAIRPISALIDSITSVTMTHFEVAIELPPQSRPRILAEAREWVQLEDKLLHHQDQQGSTCVHWVFDILRPELRSDIMAIQTAFRQIFRKLDSTGRLSMNSNARLGEKGFEVWM